MFDTYFTLKNKKRHFAFIFFSAFLLIFLDSTSAIEVGGRNESQLSVIKAESISLAKKMSGFEQFASRIRELKFKKTVKYISIKKEDVRNLLSKKLDEEYSSEEFNNKIEAYLKIGLLNSSDGLRDIMMGMLSEQVAGFYDTDNHSLYTISDLGLDPQFDSMIYIHELTHALQDQNFKLNRLGLKNKTNDDKVMAAMSLIEGDATLVIIQYFSKYAKLNFKMLFQAMTLDSRKLNSAPYVFRRSLLFPYTEGMSFAMKLHASEGWAGINKAFGNPPITTEQIIHPEKYLKVIDEPVEVKLPDIRRIVGKSWRILDNNVMGELNTQVLFTIHLDIRTARKSSAGWDGDRYIVLKNSKTRQTIFAWNTVWDSEKDANEFFSAYLHLVAKKYNIQNMIYDDKNDSFFCNNENLSIVIVRNADKVLIVEAPDEAFSIKIFRAFKEYVDKGDLFIGEK